MVAIRDPPELEALAAVDVDLGFALLVPTAGHGDVDALRRDPRGGRSLQVADLARIVEVTPGGGVELVGEPVSFHVLADGVERGTVVDHRVSVDGVDADDAEDGHEGHPDGDHESSAVLQGMLL